MKCLKYVIVSVLFIVSFPMVTKADCSYERMAELSRIAGNVQFSYEYQITDDNYPIFTVYVTNVTDDIYVIDSFDEKRIMTNEQKLTYQDFSGTINYDIYSNDSNCKDERLMSQSITLPPYNKFSVNEDCEKHRELKNCQVWTDTSDLTAESFTDSIYDQVYGSLENGEEDTDINLVEQWFLDNFNMIMLCFGGVFLILIIKLVTRKK